MDGHAGEGELAAGRFAQVVEDEEAAVGEVGEAGEVGQQPLGVLDAVLAAAADAAVGVDDDELRTQGVDHVGETVLPADVGEVEDFAVAGHEQVRRLRLRSSLTARSLLTWGMASAST